MKPSKLQPGDKLIYRCSGGTERQAVFVRREPGYPGRPARNFLRFPDFAGLDGLNDDGTCIASDYDLSRRGRFAA